MRTSRPPTGPPALHKAVTFEIRVRTLPGIKLRRLTCGLAASGLLSFGLAGAADSQAQTPPTNLPWPAASASQDGGKGEQHPAAPRRIFIGQLLGLEEDNFYAAVEGWMGEVKVMESGTQFHLSVGKAWMIVEIAGPLTRTRVPKPGDWVRAPGVCLAAYSTEGLKLPGVLRAGGWEGIEVLRAGAGPVVREGESRALPVLTTAGAVDRLAPGEAVRGYPAKIRGIVTMVAPGFPGMVVQDATHGLYVSTSNLMQLGDFVELEGQTTQGHFAPMVVPNRIVRLGRGQMPDPVQPAWDQLLNGSLSSHFVELRGVVTGMSKGAANLLTSYGRLQVFVFRNGTGAPELRRNINDVVVLRGVMLPQWDQITHQVTVGVIGICDPTVTVEQPAPADIFAAPRRTPAELRRFDSKASFFQRVCIAGQVVHLGQDEGFLMADGEGLRFVADKTQGIQVGDRVEVVGLPELGYASPVLHAAVVRKTGQAELPAATLLNWTNLNQARWDSTLVRVEATLVSLRSTPEGITLDLQAAERSFSAQLQAASGLRAPPPGSRLELTGVYAVRSGKLGPDAEGAAFDLLLNAPSNIRVLARPPWWTPQRLALLVGMLAVGLFGTLAWVTQLRRTVEQRTWQLEEQIRKRQVVEQHRAMEQERARIAKDLHDDLGSGLTEVGLLASIPATAQTAQNQIDQIANRAREMVVALDELVWAMNPKHDSLVSVGRYFCLYADRFLKLANITLEVKEALELPEVEFNSIHRHELFLAFKEALTNVVRHSAANEVWLGISVVGGKLRLALTDNGCGLKGLQPGEWADGLANMRLRVENIGGRFSVASARGRGTALRFYIPIA